MEEVRWDSGGPARLAALVLLVALGSGGAAVGARADEPAPVLDAEAIGRAAGTEARRAADGVVRIGWSRDAVTVKIDGAPLDPAAGLGSWAAFRPSEGGALVTGDTVVFEDEITPALDAALAAGLEVTALHNHMLEEEPRLVFVHYGGTGPAAELARGVGRAREAQRCAVDGS